MTPKAQKILKLIKTEPYRIGHWLGFDDLRSDLHNEWIKGFLFDKEDETLLAHRGSYKTTCLSIALALLVVIKPSQNIIFLRKTDTDTVEIIKQVQKMLESEVMHKIVNELYGVQLRLITSSVSEINTNLNESSRGTSQLIGLGVLTSITGKHGDIIVTDDVVNMKDRVSKAERTRTKNAYMELQNIKNRGGRFINTGTPWHKDDAISEMPNVTRFSCYETGLMDEVEIRALRESMTPSLFSANYELKHIADEEALFKNPNYVDNENLVKDGIAHIDASYGGSDGTAYTIAKERDGFIYVFGKRWDKHVDNCMSEIMMYHKEFRAGSIYNEVNADKGYLGGNIEALGVPVELYHEKENKYIKIATKLRKYWNRIYFVESTDRDYINEILDYTENAEHDDAPDSLASLIRAIDNLLDEVDEEETFNALNRLGL